MTRSRRSFLFLVSIALAALNAERAAGCSVAASNLSFGTVGVIDSSVDTVGDIAVTCASGANFTIALDGGVSNAPPASRQMTSGGSVLTYGLYKDPARSQPWGDANDPDGTVSGIGTGSAQYFTVYGRIPVQPSSTPGAHADTITVTVTY